MTRNIIILVATVVLFVSSVFAHGADRSCRRLLSGGTFNRLAPHLFGQDFQPYSGTSWVSLKNSDLVVTRFDQVLEVWTMSEKNLWGAPEQDIDHLIHVKAELRKIINRKIPYISKSERDKVESQIIGQIQNQKYVFEKLGELLQQIEMLEFPSEHILVELIEAKKDLVQYAKNTRLQTNEAGQDIRFLDHNGRDVRFALNSAIRTLELRIPNKSVALQEYLFKNRN